MWEYVKGSEADFECAPEWARFRVRHTEGDNGFTNNFGDGCRFRFEPIGDTVGSPYNLSAANWSIVATRYKVGQYDHLNDLPLVSEKYPQTLQSRVNDANLTEALIAERGTRYGEFKDGAAIMQQLKDVMKGAPKWEVLKPSQKEALEMIQHKIGRILNGDPDYDDNWKDIAGYATLIVKELQ